MVCQVPTAGWWFRPVNRAPSEGKLAPSSHSPPSNSLLYLAGSWMSQTSAHTTAGRAATIRSACVVGQSLWRSSG